MLAYCPFAITRGTFLLAAVSCYQIKVWWKNSLLRYLDGQLV